MEKVYDVLILGAGPAGLTAGLYAGRSGLSAGILEQGQDGGQVANTMAVENYPGQCLDGESGTSLAARMAAQAEQFGAARIQDTIQAAELQGQIKRLTGLQGEYLARAVIIATGASPRPIGCKNEAEFVGKGLSYCATCDGPLFRNRAVYVVGGGDAAVEEAVYLAKFAREVTVIHRRDRLRAAKSIQERAFQHPRIRFLWDTVVEAVDGDGVLSAMTVRNTKTGERRSIAASPADGLFGLFGYVGLLPNTALFQGVLNLENGYLVTDGRMKTNLPGVFAAGDVRAKSLRQVVTATADGAIAAVEAEKYLHG